MSYVTLPADEVLEKCSLWVDEHFKYILKLQEPLIQKEMKPKWFGLIKGKTREEATHHLECSDIWSKFHLAKLADTYRANRIEELAKAAEVAYRFGRDLNVDAKDLMILYKS